MSFENFIKRHLYHTAVYWGSPTEDGYGGKSFAEPVEIKCRWEETIQVIIDKDNEEVTSRAEVYVGSDLDENGLLFLGTLDDFWDKLESGDSSGEINPLTMSDVWLIKRTVKLPSLQSASVNLRKVYLTSYVPTYV